MSKLTNRFELRLSDEHLRRLGTITEDCGVSSKSDAIRWLIDDAYKEVRRLIDDAYKGSE